MSLRTARFLAAGYVVLMAVAVTWPGSVPFPAAPADPDSILPFLILRTDLPALVVGLFCAGALSASIWTSAHSARSCGSWWWSSGAPPTRWP